MKIRTKSRLDRQTVSTKRLQKQTDRDLILGQLTDKKEKAQNSHPYKFLLTCRTAAHVALPKRKKPTHLQNQKSIIPANPKTAVIV